jgi:hypothetical protein
MKREHEDGVHLVCMNATDANIVFPPRDVDPDSPNKDYGFPIIVRLDHRKPWVFEPTYSTARRFLKEKGIKPDGFDPTFKRCQAIIELWDYARKLFLDTWAFQSFRPYWNEYAPKFDYPRMSSDWSQAMAAEDPYILGYEPRDVLVKIKRAWLLNSEYAKEYQEGMKTARQRQEEQERAKAQENEMVKKKRRKPHSHK